MNSLKDQINWIKKKGETAQYIAYKYRRSTVIFLILLGMIPAKWVASLPVTGIYIYSGLFSLSMVCSLFFMNNMIAAPMFQYVKIAYYNRRYPKEEYMTPKIQTLIENMGLSGKTRVYVTENPAVPGPCCNNITGNVLLPRKYTDLELEPEATLSHEFGHLVLRKDLLIEIASRMLLVFAFSVIVAFITIPLICKIVIFAVEMLIFSDLFKRYEYRADEIGAKYNGPEGLISFFEYMRHISGYDDESETHPSFSNRIKRLEKMLDE